VKAVGFVPSVTDCFSYDEELLLRSTTAKIANFCNNTSNNIENLFVAMLPNLLHYDVENKTIMIKYQDAFEYTEGTGFVQKGMRIMEEKVIKAAMERIEKALRSICLSETEEVVLKITKELKGEGEMGVRFTVIYCPDILRDPIAEAFKT
jgi:hypothetical protein